MKHLANYISEIPCKFQQARETHADPSAKLIVDGSTTDQMAFSAPLIFFYNEHFQWFHEYPLSFYLKEILIYSEIHAYI